MSRRMGTILVATGLAMVAFDCSTDDDGGRNASCTTLCTEGQAGDCTAVTGSCGAFCSAVDAIFAAAGCTSQHGSYIGCLNQGINACAVDCDSQETAFTSCLTTYCLAHASDANCVTLATSF